MKTSLDRWRSIFRQLDWCPWPGPRPLSDADSDHAAFVGRQKDSNEFVSRVLRHRLVILSGESGVGKSSLLNTKLVGDLSKAGYSVLVCRKWADPLPESPAGDADSYLRRIIAPQAHALGCSLADDGNQKVFEQLDQHDYKRVVLVFDQFEQLIRHQPSRFRELSDWILAANRSTELKIVLSLRLEYVPKLRHIESGAAPYSISRQVLEPLGALEDIKAIISSEAAKTKDYIDGKAAELVAELWRSASPAPGTRWNTIGPLHVQATQYALYFHAKRAGSPRIEIKHVREMKEEAEKRVDASGAKLTLFDYGLRQAVITKLENCKKACEPRGGREAAGNRDYPPVQLDGCGATLIQGTLALAHRMVPHLSSGGYKLEREAWNLARMTLGSEMEKLIEGANKLDGVSKPIDQEAARRAYQELLKAAEPPSSGDHGPAEDDLLTVRRGQIKRLIGDPSFNSRLSSPAAEITKKQGIDVFPWKADPADVTAGPMLGLFPGDVLIEELRRLAFAQCWLEEAMLIQASPAGRDRLMLELIHDGFADALESWASSGLSDSRSALHLLTAAKGRIFDWLGDAKAPLRKPENPDDRTKHEVVVNLRWKDCQVSADFWKVVFVNCDFRGTRFMRSRFEGVVFINCLMDNVTFDDCTIHGGTSTVAPNKWKDDLLPSFQVPAERATLDELEHYRELPAEQSGRSGASWLFSRTSNVSAMPWRKDFVFKHECCQEDGGLSMFGGRLSSLMVRDCKFKVGGTLALRFIAGSSLDVVEAGDCNIDIVQSTIRGLTVTKEVEKEVIPTNGKVYKVYMNDCVVANCWFGADLDGEAEFEDCQVYQLCNLSGPNQLEVKLPESACIGLINDFSTALSGLPEPKISGIVLKKLKAMDFRSDPAKLEFSTENKNSRVTLKKKRTRGPRDEGRQRKV